MWKSWKLRGLFEEQVDDLTDYREYHFSASEWVLNLLLGGILLYFVGMCFYDSYIAMILMSPGLILFFKYRKNSLIRNRNETLKLQFKDAVMAVAAGQKAGYSIENSFREARNDMRMLHGEKSLIYKELNHISVGLDNNVVLEKMLLSLGERSGMDDIREFGEVFAIAKRNGGNLVGVIATTAAVIEEKADVEQEINVMIRSKKLESDIMSLIPFLIILYMDMTSDGFFDVLYHNVIGIVVMSICLCVYAAAFYLSKRIVSIQV